MDLENPYTTTGPANTPPTLDEVAAAISEHRDAPLTTPEGRESRRELSALIRRARSTFPATALASASGIDATKLAHLTRDVLPEAAVIALLQLRAEGTDQFGAGVRAAGAAGWSTQDLADHLGISKRAVLYAGQKGDATATVDGLRERRRPPAKVGPRIVGDVS